MASAFQIAIPPGFTSLTDQGVINAFGNVSTYIAGSLINTPTYTDATLSVPNMNPIILNSAGRFPNEVWVPAGSVIKMVFTDKNLNALNPSVWDNLAAVNDVNSNSSVSEWTTGTTPTYGSTTTFTVTGNQVGIYTQGRRLKASVTAGTVYGTIINAVFTSITTVTLRMDGATVLDNGLSSVAYGLFDPTNPSYMIETSYADGAGTANSITATFYGPSMTLVDQFTCLIDASLANTNKTVTLTLTLNTVVQTTYNIMKGNNLSLVAGDIQPHQIMQLTFNGSLNVFFLGNPSTGILGENVSVNNNLGSITGSTTIDISLGDSVYGTITGTTTFTFSNPAPTGFTQGFILELTNGGSQTVNWPASVKWAGGTAPGLTSSGVDLLAFSTRDGGTTWRGALTEKNSS